eukprot:s1543_g37.t1
MLFGYKSAPLLMGRLPSALGGLLQSMVCPSLTQLQVYADAILIAALRDKASRESQLSMLLHTAAAFSVQVNLKKGERGRRVTHRGPGVELGEPEVIILSVPQQMIDEVSVTLRSWVRAGMSTVKELRSTTGRLSRVGGALPRVRWTVNVLYVTLRDVEREQRDGTEDRRAAARHDSRSKTGLFPIKRLAGVHMWLLKLFENLVERLVRVERMKKPLVSMQVITRASPKGWGHTCEGDGRCWQQPDASGGCGRIHLQGRGKPPQGGMCESLSESVMEAFAILRSVDRWEQKAVIASHILKLPGGGTDAEAGKIRSAKIGAPPLERQVERGGRLAVPAVREGQQATSKRTGRRPPSEGSNMEGFAFLAQTSG